MDHQVVKAEVMMIRLQNTGLLVYSVLRKLIVEDLHQPQLTDQIIRERINAMRENRSLMTRFKNMIQEDCPNLKSLVETTIDQYRLLMQPIATMQPSIHFDMWTGLYKYILQHFYVYPPTIYQYALHQSVELVQQTWRNFIVEQIPMVFNRAQTPLTMESLQAHEQQLQESSASVMTTMSVPPSTTYAAPPRSTVSAIGSSSRVNTKRVVY